MRTLSFEEWKRFTNWKDFEQEESLWNRYQQNYLVEIEKRQLHVKEHGYPDCHCNICLDAIEEFEGYKKYEVFSYQGKPVFIKTFCPLDNCCDIFIQEIGTGFCEWLTIETANKYLREAIT